MTEKKRKKKKRWFASDGLIAKAGPFDSKAKAREAFRLTPAAQAKQRKEKGTEYPYSYDLKIWSE